jgi:hypothetical protein
MPAPLLVVDAPSLLYRAWFALPDSIKGAEGMPVNALLGSTNAILRVVADRAPRAVVICSGAEAARYRVELYRGYHAERPPVPDGLAWQIARSPALFEALGWTLAGTDELEADDLLHSFALEEVDAGGAALLMTGDRDMFQCASEQVTVLYLKTGVRGFEEMGPVRRPARGERDRREDGGGSAAAPRLVGGGARETDRRDATRAGRAARPGGRAARLPRHRDAAPRCGRAPRGGADAAEALGMRRLAERLRAAGDASRL